MSTDLVITTERPTVILRELAGLADDVAYFEAIREDRAHLSQFGDTTSRKYQRLEDVTASRLGAGTRLRLGIWDEETHYFAGSINATPNETIPEVEIGYWLRKSAQGHGYATLAVAALTRHLMPHYSRLFAEVHVDNEASQHVLHRAGYLATGQVVRDWGPVIVFEPIAQLQAMGTSE